MAHVRREKWAGGAGVIGEVWAEGPGRGLVTAGAVDLVLVGAVGPKTAEQWT